MHIPSSTATPPPASVKSDPTGPADRVASGPDGASIKTGVDPAVDPAAATDVTTAQGFGQMLAQRMRGGGATDRPVDATTRRDDPVGPNGTPLATTDGRTTDAPATDAVTDAATDARIAARLDPTPLDPAAGTALPIDAFAKAGVGKRGDASTTDDPVAPKDAKVDDAGNDLAAQLALVSQWAALAHPVVAKAAPGGGVDGGVAVDAAASRRTAIVSTRALDASVSKVAETGATVLPFAPTQPGLERGVRSGPAAATTTSAIMKAAGLDVQAAGAAASGTATDPASAIGALLGVADGVGPRHVNDGSFVDAFANQFTAQVSAQVADAQATIATAPTATLHETVGTPAWQHEVGQATLRLAAGDLQTASLRLNPEHLGPLDVQVRLDNGVAHLAFSAAHVETRQAIEASRTTLDQVFADQGIKVGDCAVGDSSSRRGFEADASQSGASRGDGSRWGGGASNDADVATTTVTTRTTRALGLVDTFA